MLRSLFAGLAALALTTTAAPAQDFGGPSAPPQKLSAELQAAKQRDEQAKTAFDALQAQIETEVKPSVETGDEAAMKKAFQKATGQLEAFAAKWKGTDAALISWLNVGMLRIHILEEPDQGFTVLKKVWSLAKKRPAELLPFSSITPAVAGIQLGEALVQAGRFEEARPVYEELAKGKGPEAERAVFQLEQLAVLAKVGVGKTVPSFSGEDLDGNEVTPEQYRGKVVLLDFWATWCGPCRDEMPNVVKVYKEFRSKGFDVIGISLDQAEKASLVRKFAESYGMEWKQIYDGKYWEAAVAKKFGVNSIPATFLVDRNGVIRARDLRGSELRSRVAQLVAETNE